MSFDGGIFNLCGQDLPISDMDWLRQTPMVESLITKWSRYSLHTLYPQQLSINCMCVLDFIYSCGTHCWFWSTILNFTHLFLCSSVEDCVGFVDYFSRQLWRISCGISSSSIEVLVFRSVHLNWAKWSIMPICPWDLLFLFAPPWFHSIN